MADDASHFNESEVLAELFANVTQEQDMMGGRDAIISEETALMREMIYDICSCDNQELGYTNFYASTVFILEGSMLKHHGSSSSSIETFGTALAQDRHRSLRFKAKYERRKLQEHGILPNNRATCSKGTAAVVDAADLRRCYRTPVCGQFGASVVSEDRHSIAGHMDAMKRELKEPVPDKEVVDDSMGKTFQARKELISSAASISDILEDYPALKLADQNFDEFARITSINPKQRFFERAFENLTAVLELTENKPKPHIFYKTLERMDVVEESEKQELNCLIFFCLFPLLLKETHNSFITCELLQSRAF
ncbi:uncharacterized protein ISCGN_012022 [Ixodes scapularis]